MKVGFRWMSGECKGTVDLFREADLTEETTGKVIEHTVLNEKGGLYGRAIFLASVKGTDVTLDYEAFSDLNLARNMLVGVTKVQTNGHGTLGISAILWKGKGESSFNSYPFEFVVRKSRAETLEELMRNQGSELDAALSLTSEQRRELLRTAAEYPVKLTVTTTVFQRNPLVVAEALYRANGVCGRCGDAAPFISKATNEPYLEVHHIKRLADGGSDTVDNAVALCPNCHRKAHFGIAELS